ncbi:hypothetical protein CAL26_09775 [Bordetella genomosp. 9]|uniref:Uncharacterized protein n=1 Tax=Bordetella genomosp. 9 TaxID=1416803 RepID=A0A261RGF6_9BORD|nr:hypothetical protein [Bordetella genomosp. 9]OZI23710.1 hypothetical protein CAL26_09775 [Bordetella genomosp. 9]
MGDQEKDAARWREFAARATDTKTSAWHRLLEELGLADPEECFDIAQIIDAAIAERAAKEQGNG